MPPKVAIIIVNWNGKADTLECLASLSADTYVDKQIVVVDNGSCDDSAAAIRVAFPDVMVLETGKNLGFTGGNNAGINFALAQRVDYVYLLNNDTTTEPDALQALVSAAETHPNYGLLTPVTHYYDTPEEVWFAGSQLDLSRGIAFHDNSRVPARTAEPFQIPWASGCAMLVRADLMRRLGGFDDRYFLNWEDVDLSLRVYGTGSSIGLVPAARIYHKVGRSFAAAKGAGYSAAKGAGYYYQIRNNLLLISLHGGSTMRQAMRSVVFQRLRENLRAVKNRQMTLREAVSVIFRAVRDHALRRYGVMHP